MLQRDIGKTFSDTWYRLAPSRPRLSPHAQIVRQHYGPEVSYIVEEPAGGGYYRLSEAAYFFIGLLDGTRTVQEAWDACNAQLGDAAPTQRQCVELLGKLQVFGLLLGEQPLAPDFALERKVYARRRLRERRLGKWLFLNLPVVNPEAFLERHAAVCRAAFSWAGAAVWTIVVAAGITAVIANWGQFRSSLNFAGLLRPENVLVLGIVFILLRAWHELGHAAACKAFGGRVTEIGLILIAFVLPLPYCDASSSWRFPSIRKRVIVSAGGVIFETFVAAIAAMVWAATEPGLVHSVCYNTMIISGVTTLVFNLNPLLRYDGYYILSDIAGSPNLAQRSKELWKTALHRWVFGVRTAQPPSFRGGGELALLWIYSALSFPYRLFVMVAILIMLFEFDPTLGVILAAVMLVAVFIWPVLKGVGYLISSPVLMGRRTRAIGVTAAAVGGATVLVGVVPMPSSAYAPGLVEPAESAPLRAGESGFVREVLAAPDQSVQAGQTVIRLENPVVEAELGAARARLARARASLQKAIAQSQGERYLAERDVEAAEAEVRRLEARAAALEVAAPVGGLLVEAGTDFPDLRQAVGTFVERGYLFGTVQTGGGPGELVVRVLVPDREYARLVAAGLAGPGRAEEAEPDIEVKVRGMADRTVRARIVRETQVGSRTLEEAALAAPSGGSILVDPRSTSGELRSLRPNFLLELRAADGDSLPVSAQPGLRAMVRFILPPEPLLDRWGRRVQRYLAGRLG